MFYEQSRAEQSRAEQSRAEQSRAEQSRAEQRVILFDDKCHYDSLDGLRALAAVGIIMMHMHSKSNNSYEISGVVFDRIIPFFTNFVFLFMIISAFGMCCGYFEQVSNGEISPATFYEKRYSKVFPYFAVLVLLDFVMNPTRNSLVEALADLTLVFGLLPNANISVIGVGWFLGTVFVFYMLFPFFCFLLKSRIRAWFALVFAIFYNVACTEYFMDSKHVVDNMNPRINFLYSAMFFMAGCMIYLYRTELRLFVKKFRWLVFMTVAAITIFYFLIPEKNANISNLWMLLMFSGFLAYAIGVESRILYNPMTKTLSSISMEIYLCHMAIFHVIERMHLNYIWGYGWISYMTTVVMVLMGAIIFSLFLKCSLKKCKNVIKERQKRK